MRWDEVRYGPHAVRHIGAEITVVVRDREITNAQESGMDPCWFISKVTAPIQHCD